MAEIKFKIKFITPLLIHGADAKTPDWMGLGKALRGAWRFWFRAIVGGMVQGIDKQKLFELESSVFGSADEDIGAKFRMVIENHNPKRIKIKVGFYQKEKDGITPKLEKGKHVEQTLSGYDPGCEFLIKILPRQDFNEKILVSSIWLWANLGGIGQRARRGFGAPVIESVNLTNPFESIKLSVTPHFSNPLEISEYLCNGLLKAGNVFGQWLKSSEEISQYVLTADIATNSEPKNANYFILRSTGQIAVGDKQFSLDNAIEKIHGRNKCRALGEAIGRRMASPVYVRLYEINKEFVPVVTWCKQQGFTETCKMHKNGCVKDYITNAAGITHWLDGKKI